MISGEAGAGRPDAGRVFDVTVAGSLIVLLSPVCGVIAALVRWRMGRPVLFHQRRAGRRGRPFAILKFRTMTDLRGADGALLGDEERLSPLGRRLRRTSLDELPELWNVVRGDMALVGPRPLPVTYLDRYTPAERRRHEVRPGITGWAQIHGRNTTSWEQRFAMDLWYVDHRSLWLDARILAKTVVVVITGAGISAADHATMPELRPGSERLAP